MLELRPGRECCDRGLPNGDPAARMCAFEGTFYAECAESRLGGKWPNCSGDLVLRPTRPAAMLANYPALQRRITKTPAACV